MANKVIIKQFEDGEIGVITQTGEDTLVVQAHEAELQAELESLINTITQHPLKAVSGVSETVEGRQVNKTVARTVQPGEPRYLLALADAITQSKGLVGGKRVRAYVTAD